MSIVNGVCADTRATTGTGTLDFGDGRHAAALERPQHPIDARLIVERVLLEMSVFGALAASKL